MKKQNDVMRFDPSVKKCLTLDEYIHECIGLLPNSDMLEEQWKKLPVCQIGYNSEVDTLKHIKRVSELLTNAAKELIDRANRHDESKLRSPEKELFDEWTPKLSQCTYGSEEYKGFLRELKVALDHHYANNSHHPEHYNNGVDGMNLFDLIEMFFDWKAATERHADGDILKSIDINTKRFGLSEQLKNIFTNTVKMTL